MDRPAGLQRARDQGGREFLSREEIALRKQFRPPAAKLLVAPAGPEVQQGDHVEPLPACELEIAERKRGLIVRIVEERILRERRGQRASVIVRGKIPARGQPGGGALRVSRRVRKREHGGERGNREAPHPRGQRTRQRDQAPARQARGEDDGKHEVGLQNRVGFGPSRIQIGPHDEEGTGRERGQRRAANLGTGPPDDQPPNGQCGAEPAELPQRELQRIQKTRSPGGGGKQPGRAVRVQANPAVVAARHEPQKFPQRVGFSPVQDGIGQRAQRQIRVQREAQEKKSRHPNDATALESKSRGDQKPRERGDQGLMVAQAQSEQ